MRVMYSHMSAASYTLKPLPNFGAEVFGLQLRDSVPGPVVQRIKDDVSRHRLLIFRDQGIISGPRQAEIGGWFGDLESTFRKHPRSPHPDVFRVSNDPAEGCIGVGREGWHIDGSFQPAPFSHSLYHIIDVPSRGATRFVALTELLSSLPVDQLAHWRRLSMRSDRRDQALKPLVYVHPGTGHPTMCFHTGMTAAYVEDAGSERERTLPAQPLNREIEAAIEAQPVYDHCWRAGDFLIADNLALGHEASPDTQCPVSEVGLRVMHRSTVKGTHAPT
ncbi:hypothetical protein ACKKBF_B14675 [Auxenochlorella protothecoides x Auxenochlorella symbiontica]